MAGEVVTGNDPSARVGHLLGLEHLVSPAGAGTFAVMDDTLRLLLSFIIPGLILAAAWGRTLWQVHQLTKDGEKRDAQLEDFRQQDREHSHALNLTLAGAVEGLSVATTKIAEFDERWGAQIIANAQRGRSNRKRIETLEEQALASTTAKLQAAGVPPELQQEISGQLHRRQSEVSAPTGRKS